jgi:hypothetical protein
MPGQIALKNSAMPTHLAPNNDRKFNIKRSFEQGDNP